MLVKEKRLPQVFVSPRQCTDHWRRFEGGRHALVNIKSAPSAIPFDAPVTGMDMTTFSTRGPRRINIGKANQ